MIEGISGLTYCNMFVYCQNDPIVRQDRNGTSSWSSGIENHEKYDKFKNTLEEAWMWLDEIVWDCRYGVLELVKNQYRDIPQEADVLIGLGCRTVTQKDITSGALAKELFMIGLDSGSTIVSVAASAFDTSNALNTGFYHVLSYTFAWTIEAGENPTEIYHMTRTVDIYYDIQYRDYQVIEMPITISGVNMPLPVKNHSFLE